VSRLLIDLAVTHDTHYRTIKSSIENFLPVDGDKVRMAGDWWETAMQRRKQKRKIK
jgi:hypothetical protein